MDARDLGTSNKTTRLDFFTAQGGKKRTPFCNGTDTGCARGLGNITRRASGQTSRRCLGTRTREESIQKVLQMVVALCHWCYLPREGIDFSVVSCSQQVV